MRKTSYQYTKDWMKRDPAGYRSSKNGYVRRWRASHKEEYRQKKQEQDTRTFKQFLGRCLRSRKSNDKRIGREFNLDIDYVLDLLEKQDQKCALTGVQLTHNFNDPFAASIDRIDSTKGHVPGNIQIVCAFVNFAKCQYDNEACKKVIEQIKLNLLTKLRDNNLLVLR